MKKYFTTAVTALMITACAQSGSLSATDVLVADGPVADVPQAETMTHTPSDNFAQANTRMGVDLYRKLRESETGNLFMSPLSLSSAIGMTYAGAKGQTGAEIAAVMHYPASGVHEQIGTLQREINKLSIPPYEDSTSEVPLTIAINNSVWVDKELGLKPEYVNTLEQDYASEIQRADFRNDPSAGTAAINAWTQKQTRDKIKNLIAPGMLDKFTRLVLVNTVYLKSDWLSVFAEDMTQDRPFAVDGGPRVDVATMHQTSSFKRARIGAAEAISMPYFGNQLSMAVILPDADDGLPNLESRLTDADISTLFSDLDDARFTHTDLRLPKFKVETGYKLTKTLQALGLVEAFDRTEADFSGIQTGNEPLFLSDVIQKTFLDVSEKGTEAAAATYVEMGTYVSLPRLPPPPTEFHVDHPFMLLIRHNRTGAVIFMGGITDPRG